MENHWANYMKAFEKPIKLQTSMPSYENTSPDYNVSGFLDIKVKNPEIQARYDAMSGNWEGVSASESAISNNIFRTESMPIKQNNTTK